MQYQGVFVDNKSNALFIIALFVCHANLNDSVNVSLGAHYTPSPYVYPMRVTFYVDTLVNAPVPRADTPTYGVSHTNLRTMAIDYIVISVLHSNEIIREGQRRWEKYPIKRSKVNCRLRWYGHVVRGEGEYVGNRGL